MTRVILRGAQPMSWEEMDRLAVALAKVEGFEFVFELGNDSTWSRGRGYDRIVVREMPTGALAQAQPAGHAAAREQFLNSLRRRRGGY